MMGRKMKAIIFHLLPIMFLPKLRASWEMQVQAVPGTFREKTRLSQRRKGTNCRCLAPLPNTEKCSGHWAMPAADGGNVCVAT